MLLPPSIADVNHGDSRAEGCSSPSNVSRRSSWQHGSPQRDSSSSLGLTQPAEDSARPHEQAAEKEERREAELARDKLLADLTMREEARRKMIESLQSGSDSISLANGRPVHSELLLLSVVLRRKGRRRGLRLLGR